MAALTAAFETRQQQEDRKAMEADLAIQGERAYWEWVAAMELSDQTLRELNSYPEAVEALPW